MKRPPHISLNFASNTRSPSSSSARPLLADSPTRHSFLQRSRKNRFVHAIMKAANGGLAQVLTTSRARLALGAALCLTFLVYFSSPSPNHDAGFGSRLPTYKAASSTGSSWLSWGWRSSSSPATTTMPHPIPSLMSNAQQKFRSLMSKQSKTLAQAVAEYKKRYGRSPPKGFDDWWAFTQENNVKIIDEYDQLMKDLEPFWALPGKELRRRAAQVGTLPSVDLVRLENGKAFTVNVAKGFDHSDVSARAKGFRLMIEKFQHKLPDMDFPINAKAEGRILVPWEHSKYPNTTKQDSSGGVEDMLGGPFIHDWRGDGSVWDAYRRTCDPSSQARRLFGALRPKSANTAQRPINRLELAKGGNGLPTSPDSDFRFAEDVDNEFDFCDYPWARYNQGHFFSDWRTIPALYPMFSPAKGQGFSDILIPSHYYYSSTKRYTYGWDSVNMILRDEDENEVPWDKKTNTIFWRGATTGGGSSPPGFLAQYQRHRFIRMTSDESDVNRTVVFRWPTNDPTSEFTYARVPISALNEDIMDTAFTKAVGCTQYPGGCDGIRKDHRFADAVQLGEHWKHKYLVDFDGMGYSARLFAFLMSESAVVKATVYKEFFSDWIQPWLHYIPLSSDYSEIYNIHAYFSGPSASTAAIVENAVNGTTVAPDGRAIKVTTEPKELLKNLHDGDAELRKIARAGRKWKMSIGRTVDMETYVYRLCLEYARLWADDREEMSYKA